MFQIFVWLHIFNIKKKVWMFFNKCIVYSSFSQVNKTIYLTLPVDAENADVAI